MPIRKEELKVGQKVRYHPVGNAMQLTDGVIKEIVTHPEVYYIVSLQKFYYYFMIL